MNPPKIGQAEPTAPTLRASITNLATHSQGSGLGGSVNVESGAFEFSSRRSRYACESCADQRGFTRECATCGRAPGNNISFLAGRGDGVYSSVVFYGQGGLDALATVWVFDEHNAFSQSTLTAINSGLKGVDVLKDLLVPGLVEYLDLPGIVVGEIDSADNESLVGSDVSMRIFDDAMVVVPWSEGHKYTIAVYFEPVISSLGLEIGLGGDRDGLTGGFEESLRPRVAIAIDSRYASEILSIDSELAERHDWARQHDAWATMPVASNLSASNGPAVAHNNGLLWLRYLEIAGMPALDKVSALYFVEALGWFVQASAEGDDEATVQIQKIYARYGSTLLDRNFLELAVISRGFALTHEVEEFVRDVCAAAT